MGFKQVRQQALAALRAGAFQHEARDDINEKNLLATGAVTPQQVVGMLLACRGTQYECAPHHEVVKDVEVHIFKPVCSLAPGGRKTKWYIKLYFLPPDAWFISVH